MNRPLFCPVSYFSLDGPEGRREYVVVSMTWTAGHATGPHRTVLTLRDQDGRESTAEVVIHDPCESARP